MKILVFGSDGQVGRELSLAFASSKAVDGQRPLVVKANRGDIDLADSARIPSFLAQIAPNFIVNASAYTAVDKAESEEEVAVAVNATAVGEMAKFCQSTGSALIHISTDYVFEGKDKTPYVESDLVGPTGAYGRSKLAGESAIRDHLDKHIILRTSWVYGAFGNNFVKTMLRLAQSGEELSVVEDQFGAPTSARAIAKTITTVISQLANAGELDLRWGTYHFSGYPFVSWSTFAGEIFSQALTRELIESLPKVNPISTGEYPTPAIRPANSRLDCSKLQSAFGIEPDDWKRSLGLMLDELKERKET